MIKRTPKRAEGGITTDEKKAMDAIAKKWIANAYKTGPVNRQKLTAAIEKLYLVSGLKKPRVVIVPSPLVMALSYGLSAGIWYLRKKSPTTFAATYAATDATTFAATYAAMRDATYSATDAATRDATYAATDAATRATTRDATRDATDAATRASTYFATESASKAQPWLYRIAREVAKDEYSVLLQLCTKWADVYQPGNMWSGFCAYAEVMRDVLKLKLDCWEKYSAWEECAIEGGFRVMHEKFCIVSEFPVVLRVNRRNQPHCETGPSHLWSDGFAIYHLNGVRVPQWLVMTTAEQIDPQKAIDEKNSDVQREIIRKIGAERMLQKLNAVSIDEAVDPQTGLRYALKEMVIGNVRRKYLYFEHASMPGIWYAKPVPPETQKALHGRAWILSLINRDELSEITREKEVDLIANFPTFVS